MTDIPVETYDFHAPKGVMDVFNPLAYEVPDHGRALLKVHRNKCLDCIYVTDGGHDCPDCTCIEEYWETCDDYRALYDSLKEPVLAEDGRHMRMSEQMDRHLRRALFSMGPYDTPRLRDE